MFVPLSHAVYKLRSDKRKAQKHARTDSERNSFEAVAREWFDRSTAKWVASYSSKVMGRLEKDVFPWIGTRSIADVEAPELLEVLRRVEGRGALETARRERQTIGLVFRYAIATARVKHNPAEALAGALATPEKQSFAALTDPSDIAGLMRAIHGYQGYFATSAALRLAPLVFVRPGELRLAQWSEIDFAAAEWRIPAERMKQRKAAKRVGGPHIVPLAAQALAVLSELHQLSGRGLYLFSNIRTRARGMSENTINAALRRLGYTSAEIVGHGFRAMASTALNGRGWSGDAIERQLAHKAQGVRAVYNRAEYMPERRRMMQAWADYLEALRNTSPGGSLPTLRGPED